MKGRINSQFGQFVKKGIREPIGVCDYSGFWFSKSDLVKQKEWRGNSLVWNGFLVGKPFADVPNPQARPPIVKNDPQPVDNPRPMGQQGQVTIEATIEHIRLEKLNEIVYNKPLPIVENLPTLAGRDVSKESYDERLAKLQGII